MILRPTATAWPELAAPRFMAALCLCCGLLLAMDVSNAAARQNTASQATRLAIENTQQDNNAAATIDSYQRVIAQLTAAQGMANPALFEPLTGLGAAYLKAGAPAQAIQVFEQAIQISRLELGLHSLKQLPLIDQLTAAYVALNLWDKANKQQLYAYFLQLRTQGDNVPASLPAMNKLAAWSVRAKRFPAAKALYLKMLRIIETHRGKQHLDLVPPLLGLTAFYLAYRDELVASIDVSASALFAAKLQTNHTILTGVKPVDWFRGKRALNRVLQLYKQNPEATALDVALTEARLGDWYMLFDRPMVAYIHYKNAIALLQAQPEYASNLEHLFSAPTLLHFPKSAIRLKPPITENSCWQRECSVEFSYTVDSKGLARYFTVTSAKPSASLNVDTKKAVNLIRYRPAFQDGKAITTAAVRYRYVHK